MEVQTKSLSTVRGLPSRVWVSFVPFVPLFHDSYHFHSRFGTVQQSIEGPAAQFARSQVMHTVVPADLRRTKKSYALACLPFRTGLLLHLCGHVGVVLVSMNATLPRHHRRRKWLPYSPVINAIFRSHVYDVHLSPARQYQLCAGPHIQMTPILSG